MKIFTLFALAYFIVISISCSQENNATESDDPNTYKLVWSDEFETDGKPDPANWTFENGFVRNEELQWYQPDNAFCENGMLIIEGRKESKPNPNYNPISSNWKENRPYADYTSSSLKTMGLHSWRFGRFEMKAKIVTQAGLWPAFWTLGVSREWPHGGEVDIMEYYAGKILANYAWGAAARWQAVWDSFDLQVSQLGDPDWSNKFHVWRLDWDEESMKIYLDDVMLNSVNLATTINRDGTNFNPFLQNHYILVNLAIGGTAGGDPSGTQFPSRYEIDYVRVYQKPGQD